MVSIFRTEVFKLFLLFQLLSGCSFGQFGQDEFLFIASTSQHQKRIVSDLHVLCNATRDTLTVELFILEDWKGVDSVKTFFYLDRNSTDTVFNCQQNSFSVFVYQAPSGERLFIQKPTQYLYFDNYGQQKKYWEVQYAAIDFVGPRKKYNAVFDCFHGK